MVDFHIYSTLELWFWNRFYFAFIVSKRRRIKKRCTNTSFINSEISSSIHQSAATVFPLPEVVSPNLRSPGCFVLILKIFIKYKTQATIKVKTKLSRRGIRVEGGDFIKSLQFSPLKKNWRRNNKQKLMIKEQAKKNKTKSKTKQSQNKQTKNDK